MKEIGNSGKDTERIAAFRTKLDEISDLADGEEIVTKDGFKNLQGNLEGVPRIHPKKFASEAIGFFRASVQMRTMQSEGVIDDKNTLHPYLTTDQVLALVVAYSLDGKVRFTQNEMQVFVETCGDALQRAEKKLANHLVNNHVT